jgi:predicted negative regulator of RcsB-dependent stress response
VIAFLPIGLLTCFVSGYASAQVYVPAAPEEVVVQLPQVAAGRFEARLTQLRRAWQANPDEPNAAAELASLYVQLSRQTGEARYIGMAKKVIAAWPGDAPASVLLIRADLTQLDHQFAAALADYEKLESLAEAYTDQVKLNHAVLLLVMGRYKDARRKCSAVAQAGVAILCEASIEIAAYRLEEAERLLLTIRPGEVALMPSWYFEIKGQLARAKGDFQGALEWWNSAVQAGNSGLKIAILEVQLLQAAPEKALALESSIVPTVPARLRLAMAAKLTGDASLAERLDRLANDFAYEPKEARHHRELAIYHGFLRGDLAQAREAAIANFAYQREPIDTQLIAQFAPDALELKEWLAAEDIDPRMLSAPDTWLALHKKFAP